MRLKHVLFLISLLWQAAAIGQVSVTLSGRIAADSDPQGLPYLSVNLLKQSDSTFVSGTITDSTGRYILKGIPPGGYLLRVQGLGWKTTWDAVNVGSLSENLDLGTISLVAKDVTTGDVVIEGRHEVMKMSLEKQSYSIDQNLSQGGGSLLQAMQNLPGVTVSDGKVSLRGSDRVTVLIDGKQTALTGFGSQSGLDNIPASAIERIEIIQNPGAKYDANGMAGIVNIVYKKTEVSGFNGKASLIGGVGSLRQKAENLPDIRPQYRFTPKINPSLSLNYRRKSLNWFLQGDALIQQSINKNEYIDRTYDNGAVIHGQFLENRDQLIWTAKTGVDLYVNDRNSITVSGLFNREGHIDRGDLPYFNEDLSSRYRLWLYYESEINKSANASAAWTHRFQQPGHKIDLRYNYTWHQEDEWFYFSNIYPVYASKDTVHLLYDENVMDLTLDYVKPLRRGRLEAGAKSRWRFIPSSIAFIPGDSTILDPNADGRSRYDELINAFYANYVLETNRLEWEAGLRMEQVNVDYHIDDTANVYGDNGYRYIQPFPSTRFAIRLNSSQKIQISYSRRVDRPDEVDLRMFPKYDDPEVLKVGNPGLVPQLTQSFELAYKLYWKGGSFYTSLYHRESNHILTRVLTQVPSSTLLVTITQNAGRGRNSGAEVFLSQNFGKWLTLNLTGNIYQNTIDSFSGTNKYPVDVPFSSASESILSGNAKANALFHLPKKFDLQLTAVYLAPDVIPQGRIDSRFSLDFGAKKSIQGGKGELFLNGTDLLGTVRIRKTLTANGFTVLSNDLYETQAFRLGYAYKF
ncbi:MAG: TonB-dependent receptor [Bacteroidia bacterium]